MQFQSCAGCMGPAGERTGSRLWGDLVHQTGDTEPQWRIDKVLDMTNGPFPALKWTRSKLVLQTKANPTQMREQKSDENHHISSRKSWGCTGGDGSSN